MPWSSLLCSTSPSSSRPSHPLESRATKHSSPICLNGWRDVSNPSSTQSPTLTERRPNVRRRHIRLSRGRGAWCLRLLRAGLPVHRRCALRHHDQVLPSPLCSIRTTSINKGRRYLDIPALLAWLTARQTNPEGGFSGRTNKLVDGCYSHWVGGCWALLEAALLGPRKTASLPKERLWDREALARYILCCCQGPKGGLRDKPGKCVVFFRRLVKDGTDVGALQTSGCVSHVL